MTGGSAWRREFSLGRCKATHLWNGFILSNILCGHNRRRYLVYGIRLRRTLPKLRDPPLSLCYQCRNRSFLGNGDPLASFVLWLYISIFSSCCLVVSDLFHVPEDHPRAVSKRVVLATAFQLEACLFRAKYIRAQPGESMSGVQVAPCGDL